MKIRYILIGALLGPIRLMAGSVAGTGGATEVTQIMNNVELVKQAAEIEYQTTQLRNQLQRQSSMLSDMTKQGKTLSQYEWGEAAQDLQKLSAVVREGEALAYSSANLDALYRQKYKGYAAYSRESAGTSDTYSDRYSEWSKTNMDSIVGAMKAAQLQGSQFSDEEESLQTIKRLGQSSQGRMEAIQVGNLIASQQVGQMQKLRGLVLSQMQMQASYMAFQTNEKDANTAKSEKYFKNDYSKVNIQDGRKY